MNANNSFLVLNVQDISKKEFLKETNATRLFLFFPYCNFKFRAKFDVCLFIYFDFWKAEYFFFLKFCNKNQNEFIKHSKGP